MPIDELIRLLETDPDSVISLPEAKTPEVFDVWIRRCLKLVSENPQEGLPHLDTALAIAQTSCEIVLCYGVRAAAHRNLGELERAGLELDLAFRVGRSCQACEADLFRRRAHFNTSMSRMSLALRDVDAAVEAYCGLEGPDHDLWNNGLGHALHSRADIRQYFGIDTGDESLILGAVSDFGEALSLAHPVEHRELYGHALFNLGAVLRYQGGFENLRLANQHIRKARKYFSGRKGKASRERAHLDWQTAMVRFELRNYDEGLAEVSENPSKLRDMLVRSRDGFIEVRMPVETAAVASDLSKVLYPKRRAIIDVMDVTERRIEKQLHVYTPEVRRSFEPVRQAMRAVRQAAGANVMTMSTAELHTLMRSTIDRLRETCAEATQGVLLPCLLTWQEAKSD